MRAPPWHGRGKWSPASRSTRPRMALLRRGLVADRHAPTAVARRVGGCGVPNHGNFALKVWLFSSGRAYIAQALFDAYPKVPPNAHDEQPRSRPDLRRCPVDPAWDHEAGNGDLKGVAWVRFG